MKAPVERGPSGHGPPSGVVGVPCVSCLPGLCAGCARLPTASGAGPDTPLAESYVINITYMSVGADAAATAPTDPENPGRTQAPERWPGGASQTTWTAVSCCVIVERLSFLVESSGVFRDLWIILCGCDISILL